MRFRVYASKFNYDQDSEIRMISQDFNLETDAWEWKYTIIRWNVFHSVEVQEFHRGEWHNLS